MNIELPCWKATPNGKLASETTVYVSTRRRPLPGGVHQQQPRASRTQKGHARLPLAPCVAASHEVGQRLRELRQRKLDDGAVMLRQQEARHPWRALQAVPREVRQKVFSLRASVRQNLKKNSAGSRGRLTYQNECFWDVAISYIWSSVFGSATLLNS